jgi:hypothetical protein
MDKYRQSFNCIYVSVSSACSFRGMMFWAYYYEKDQFVNYERNLTRAWNKRHCKSHDTRRPRSFVYMKNTPGVRDTSATALTAWLRVQSQFRVHTVPFSVLVHKRATFHHKYGFFLLSCLAESTAVTFFRLMQWHPENTNILLLCVLETRTIACSGLHNGRHKSVILHKRNRKKIYTWKITIGLYVLL